MQLTLNNIKEMYNCAYKGWWHRQNINSEYKILHDHITYIK